MTNIIKLILYQPLFNVLIFLIWLIPGHNVGWAIIILTVIVRLALLPSSLKATRQQKHMQDLQPHIQEIQTKYKDDKKKLSEELMAFYRRNKVNPLGSCLPLLIQLPILIVLYYVFINGLSTDHFSLVYNHWPRPEFIRTFFLGIDLAKPDKFILPIIAGALQFYQAWQITPKNKPQPGQEMQSMISKQMLYLMPIFTVFIAGRFPAALPLYWIITTLFSIGQQWWVFREEKIIAVFHDGEISDEKETKKEQKKEKLFKKISKKGVEVTVRRKGEK